LTVYAALGPLGLISYRSHSWDSPFRAFPFQQAVPLSRSMLPCGLESPGRSWPSRLAHHGWPPVGRGQDDTARYDACSCQRRRRSPPANLTFQRSIRSGASTLQPRGRLDRPPVAVCGFRSGGQPRSSPTSGATPPLRSFPPPESPFTPRVRMSHSRTPMLSWDFSPPEPSPLPRSIRFPGRCAHPNHRPLTSQQPSSSHVLGNPCGPKPVGAT